MSLYSFFLVVFKLVPKYSVQKMGPQSFSTVLHVFCSIEALKWFDKGFCIPFLSRIILRGLFFFFLIQGRILSKFPSEEEIFTDYISFPLGIKKWRRALK